MHNTHTQSYWYHIKSCTKYLTNILFYILPLFSWIVLFSFTGKGYSSNTYRHTIIDILIKVKTIEKYWVHDIYFDSAKKYGKKLNITHV